jgi:hypothetical protein
MAESLFSASPQIFRNAMNGAKSFGEGVKVTEHAHLVSKRLPNLLIPLIGRLQMAPIPMSGRGKPNYPSGGGTILYESIVGEREVPFSHRDGVDTEGFHLLDDLCSAPISPRGTIAKGFEGLIVRDICEGKGIPNHLEPRRPQVVRDTVKR